MFKPNPKGQYMMPAHFGYRSRGRDAAAKPEYHDTHTLTISYLTDAEMLSQFLPEPFPLTAIPWSMYRRP